MKKITVYPDTQTCTPKTAKATTGEPTVFIFKLDNSNDWEWAGTSPVAVQAGGAEFSESFVHTKQGGVVLFDKNTYPNTYKYTVTAINKTTGQIVPIDPFIQNQ